MSVFHAMVTSGRSFSREEADAGNGPIASPCYAALLVDGLGGCGTQRITSGPRSIRNSRRDGSTSMLARKRGILLGYIVKVCLWSFILLP